MKRLILMAICIALLLLAGNVIGISKVDKIKKLEPVKYVEEFNDSLLIGQPLSIEIGASKIYVSHTGNNQMLVLDTNLNCILEMIPKGRGPLELNYVNKFLIYDRIIYIGNTNLNKLSRFSENGVGLGEVESTYNNFTTGCRFLINNGYMYFSYPDSQTGTSLRQVLLSSDSSLNSWESFGPLQLYENGYRTHLLNLTDVFGDEDRIYAVEKSRPCIHVYNKENLELLYSVDLDNNIPAIKDSYRLVKDKMDKFKQSGIQIFLDSYFSDGKLYLLMLDWVSQDKSHIFVLDVHDKMNVVNHYTTPLITSIAVDGRCLYSLTYEGGVAIFRIEL